MPTPTLSMAEHLREMMDHRLTETLLGGASAPSWRGVSAVTASISVEEEIRESHAAAARRPRIVDTDDGSDRRGILHMSIKRINAAKRRLATDLHAMGATPEEIAQNVAPLDLEMRHLIKEMDAIPLSPLGIGSFVSRAYVDEDRRRWVDMFEQRPVPIRRGGYVSVDPGEPRIVTRLWDEARHFPSQALPLQPETTEARIEYGRILWRTPDDF